MLITPDLFLDCIILLIHDNGARNQGVVKELIGIYEAESQGASVEGEELIRFYIRALRLMMSNDIDKDNPNELRHLLLKFKSDKILEKRRDIYDLLHETFMSRDMMSEEKLARIAKRVQNQLVWNRMNKVTRGTFGRLGRAKDMVDPESQAGELQKILDDMKTLADETEGSVGASHNLGMVDRISFADKESMKLATKKHKDRNVLGVVRTGLQGLNRMLGASGGIVLGESILFNALSHNFKSGMLQSVAMWAALYNDPVVEDGRKPIVIMVSLENEAFQNFMWISKKVYYQETGIDATGLDDDELVNWIYDRFGQNGFAFEILRYLPDQFGYEELVALVNHYEAQGYYVYMVVIDYMNNMRKGGDKSSSGAGNHLMVKELYNKSTNYMKTKGASLISAHQLNREAQKLANSGKSNVVKSLNSEHLADSVDVQREVDGSIYMHIERNHEGIPFLTLCINKHRYVDNTPEAHKYCAYPFTHAGIMDDINGPPGYVRDIYSYSLDNHAQNVQLAQDYNELQPPGDRAEPPGKPVEVVADAVL